LKRIGFDNDKYIELQSKHIRERVDKFGDKLYLELGGKLFDDFHASRVLPGFEPDSKMKMLKQLSDKIEIVIAISAVDLVRNKVRNDLNITYDVANGGTLYRQYFTIGPAQIAMLQSTERGQEILTLLDNKGWDVV